MPLTLTTLPVAQVVKNETRVCHSETEAVLLPVLQSLRSLHDYAAVLKMFYGFYRPLEEHIHQQLDATHLPDLGERRSARHLKADLQALGITTAIPVCDALPQINNAAAAFGALYVLEGSTLGGRVILKMLRSNPALNIPEDALQFFGGYGERTGSMWTAFVDVLNRQDDTEQIARAAQQTFVDLKNWMQETLAHDKAAN